MSAAAAECQNQPPAQNVQRQESQIISEKQLVEQTQFGEESPLHGRLFMSKFDESPVRAVADFTDVELAALRNLAKSFPNLDCAAGELAFQESLLARPPGNVHVISDIHGAATKLKFVLANASGTIRPMVEDLLTKRGVKMSEINRTLLLIFSSSAFVDKYTKELSDENGFFLENTLILAVVVLSEILKPYSLSYIRSILPSAWSKLLREMLFISAVQEGGIQECNSKTSFYSHIAHSIRTSNRMSKFLGVISNLIRTFSVEELLVNGDLWDRGPRGDQVFDILQSSPNVWITWGNHDILWFGAALGCEAAMINALRISLRYSCLAQFEEGYGISLEAVETLANTAYKEDPATLFVKSSKGLRRGALTIGRMEKACAMIQFKLEGQIIKRHPEWNIDKDLIIHTFDTAKGTCIVEGKEYPLRDTHFPTLDPKDPYTLSPAEAECVEAMRLQFFRSEKLWDQMKHLINRGSAYVVRHNHLIFHAGIPVNKDGSYQSLEINGKKYKGKELFDATQKEIITTLRRPTQYRQDFMWYLWMGAQSIFMCKERVATLQRYFISDTETHKEPKNAYFNLIHEVWFCDKLLTDFGCQPEGGMIINGHVPVSVKAEENPMKRSGKCVVIDGAFSEAYGDYGYTFVIEPANGRSLLVQHHKVNDAFDVMPATKAVVQFDPTKMSTQYYGKINGDIKMLKGLLSAYESNTIPQVTTVTKAVASSATRVN